MSHFSFLCRTKTSFGKNALEHLPFDLAAMGSSKPMVIQDKASHLAGLTKPVIRAFKESGMTIGISPPIPETREGDANFIKSMYTHYTEKGYDALIALGRQTAGDAAKALNIAVSLGPESLKKKNISQRLNPLIYLPIGAASGAATAGMARFNNQTFMSDFLAPDQAVIDPSLFIPDEVDTLIDVSLTCLATGAEVLGLSRSLPARAYASAIIRLGIAPLESIIQSNKDHQNQPQKIKLAWQKDLVQAGVMAGYLMSEPLISNILGQTISDQTRISQGQAMCIVLPPLLEALGTEDMEGLLLALKGQESFSTVPLPLYAQTSVQAIRSLVNSLYGVSRGRRPRTLEEAGWNKTAIVSLGEKLVDSGTLKGIDPNTLETILTCACDGRPVIQG
ncbi:MAG: iron-containing alcohol dehydrogenase [Desulfobacter sp.]|nr:iron-containing alcohol dehydrogenase [Desulfobacter sp.]